MTQRNPTSVIAELSHGQWGMVTSAQAHRRGVSRLVLSRLAARGDLERLAHGVYREAGAPGDERDHLRAAWLAIRPEATAEERLSTGAEGELVSGAAAAWLHGLGTLRPEPYLFCSPERLQTRRSDVRFRRRRLDGGGATVVGGLPTTTPEQTIADLVEWRTDLSLVAEVVADAVAARVLDPADAVERLAPLAGRHGLSPDDGAALLDQLLHIGGMDPAAVAQRAGSSALGGAIAAEHTAALARRLQELTELPPGLAQLVEELSAALVPVIGVQRAIGASLVPTSEAVREQLAASEAIQRAVTARLAPAFDAALAAVPLVPMPEESRRGLTELAPLLDSVERIVARSEVLAAAAGRAAS